MMRNKFHSKKTKLTYTIYFRSILHSTLTETNKTGMMKGQNIEEKTKITTMEGRGKNYRKYSKEKDKYEVYSLSS